MDAMDDLQVAAMHLESALERVQGGAEDMVREALELVNEAFYTLQVQQHGK